MAELTLDREYHAKGIQLLCGVDEAGRGPLAGPVFAAAVILPADKEIPGLNDSKKLSEKKREALYDVIRQEALAYCVASASEAEIDELNILGATFLAMHRAVEGLSQVPELVLVNPPRRGIGQALCGYLSQMAPEYIVYSSCNAQTMAKDIAHLPGYRIERVQLFDMFPHTAHYEVLTLLVKTR